MKRGSSSIRGYGGILAGRKLLDALQLGIAANHGSDLDGAPGQLGELRPHGQVHDAQGALIVAQRYIRAVMTRSRYGGRNGDSRLEPTVRSTPNARGD